MLSPVGAENCARRQQKSWINRHYANWLWGDWMYDQFPFTVRGGWRIQTTNMDTCFQ